MNKCALCGGDDHTSDECTKFDDKRYRVHKINRRAAYWAAFSIPAAN